jgi:hypothetical protein
MLGDERTPDSNSASEPCKGCESSDIGAGAGAPECCYEQASSARDGSRNASRIDGVFWAVGMLFYRRVHRHWRGSHRVEGVAERSASNGKDAVKASRQLTDLRLYELRI